MSALLLPVILIVAVAMLILQIAASKRQGNAGIESRLDLLNQSLQQTGRSIGDEFSRLRQELVTQMQALRLDLTTAQKTQLDDIRATMETRLAAMSADN
jgi:hypothetical protein